MIETKELKEIRDSYQRGYQRGFKAGLNTARADELARVKGLKKDLYIKFCNKCTRTTSILTGKCPMCSGTLIKLYNKKKINKWLNRAGE